MGNSMNKYEQLLNDAGQSHLLDKVKDDSSKLNALLEQVKALDATCPGGLVDYAKRARELLAKAKAGENPFDGYTPQVPTGEKVELGDASFADFEKQGLGVIGQCSFVLVAGGLGERLGYHGIKVGLECEVTTGKTFLQLYVDHIMALQALTGGSKRIPLTIMTSDDTHAPTVQLLKEHSNFGMAADQITIVKQEKVPALVNNSAQFASDDSGLIQTKPHGHGDVHTLIHQHGLTTKWLKEGRKYVVFFQDTNSLIFKVLPAAIGVSVARSFDVNSITVPRAAGEAAGAICRLVHTSGKEMTLNVEYNQLDPLLRAAGTDGDVADVSGFSPYPGNINNLIFALESYDKTLKSTGGVIPEFVNPKYADESKDAFKSPTRLECMMQDYPKLLPPESKVGFVQFERDLSFSAVKNNLKDAAVKACKSLPPECASSGEFDFYAANARLLQDLCNADVQRDVKKVEYAGVSLSSGPRVVLAPSFLPSTYSLPDKVKGKVSVSARSTLVLEGNVTVDGLKLDGALVVRATNGAVVNIKGLEVSNEGHELEPIDVEDQSIPESLRIRGYRLKKNGERVIEISEPGTHTVSA